MITKKTVIITGGNKGIGLSISKSFAEAGYFVIVGARNKVSFPKKYKNNILFLKSDIKKESSHKMLVKKAIELTGRLDVYVNNAGISEWSPIDKVNLNLVNKLINTNLVGALWGCKTASKAMKKGSSIINISSIAGKRGTSNNSVYCATKFAVTGITQSLAKELGPRGIRVNSICPVLIKTKGLMKALKNKNSPAKNNPNNFIKEFAKNNAALKRLPLSSEVAEVCVFLSSNSASAITGQNINVDCGVFPQ
tara:strand:+ start:178 stop:930 length:753 start_codon:yes stop_codon:yes gene_type:complete